MAVIRTVICTMCIDQRRWLSGLAPHERLRAARGALVTPARCAECQLPLQPPTEALAVIRWDGRYAQPPGHWESTVLAGMLPITPTRPPPRGGGGPERG